MLDIGWSEMAMIALLALIVIGPKDLPRVMRSIGQWTRKARSIARDFQSGLDDMMRESELDEAKKTVERTSRFDVGEELEREVDPGGTVRESAQDLERSARFEHTETPTAPGNSVQSGKSESGSSGSKSGAGSKSTSGSKSASGSKSGSSKSGGSKATAGKSGGKSSGGKSTGKTAAGTSGGGSGSGGKSSAGRGSASKGSSAKASGGGKSGGGGTTGTKKTGTKKTSSGGSKATTSSGSA